MTSQQQVAPSQHPASPDPEGATAAVSSDPSSRTTNNNTNTNHKASSDPPAEYPASPQEGEENIKQPQQPRNAATDDAVKTATATDATADSDRNNEPADMVCNNNINNNTTAAAAAAASDTIVVSSSRKSRPPYQYDPNRMTLRFLFANRDGLVVTVECKPSDTVGEVKGALLSVWPEDLPDCGSGDNVRLVCMGKGFLTPDTRTLEDCQIPIFKTHPTPINVSVKPGPVTKPHEGMADHFKKNKGSSAAAAANSSGGAAANTDVNGATVTHATNQGCGCVIQ